MTGAPQEPSIIWATRGRNWGFRFLLKGGLADPLPAYERAFDQLKDVPSFWRRDRTRAALRFPDPEGRTDAAGRVIPHEFVIVGIPTGELGSFDEARRWVWSKVADAYASVWDRDQPPRAEDFPFS